MDEDKCDICVKIFDKKDSYRRHMKYKSLCLKDVNCKELYRNYNKLKEEYKLMEEELERMEEKYDSLKLELNSVQSERNILDVHMADIINSRGNIINNITNNNYIIVTDPIPFDQIEWDLSDIDIEFLRSGPEPLAKYIADKVRIHTTKDGTRVLSYCNTDITREKYIRLNSDYEYVKDAGANYLIENVIENKIKPHYYKLLAQKYTGFPNIPVDVITKLTNSQKEQACFDLTMWAKLFVKGTDYNKKFASCLKTYLYMGTDIKQRLRFLTKDKVKKKNNENRPTIEEIIETNVTTNDTTNVTTSDTTNVTTNVETNDTTNGESVTNSSSILETIAIIDPTLTSVTETVTETEQESETDQEEVENETIIDPMEDSEYTDNQRAIYERFLQISKHTMENREIYGI